MRRGKLASNNSSKNVDFNAIFKCVLYKISSVNKKYSFRVITDNFDQIKLPSSTSKPSMRLKDSSLKSSSGILLG